MLVWYAATAVVAVWAVFDSPMLDYRLVAVGSVLPVAQIVLGGPGPLHSLPVAVVVLFGVMAVTRGRRLVRRRLLGIPIGLMAALVFSGVWTDTEVFWWPLGGFALPEGSPPELARGAWSLVLEGIGIGLTWWWYQRVGLDDADGRATFARTGHLPRPGTRPVGGSC